MIKPSVDIDDICREIIKTKRIYFEPSGTQEDFIAAAGSGEYEIVLKHDANKGPGKTATAANILKNIIFEPDLNWFDYPLFREWPYPKKGRFVSTKENLGDTGPIREEVTKWWPAERYKSEKGSRHFYSRYFTDTEWVFDCLSYDQQTQQFEGKGLGLVWCDEPVPERLMGAIMSRFEYGGLILITATLVNCGIFVDALNDIMDQGTKVQFMTSTLYENSVTAGKPNSKGTKRGTMTDEQIDKFVSRIPPHERNTRVMGQISNKGGKIYPMFNRDVHVKTFEPVKIWNTYMSMDPHYKYYPAMTWWAVTGGSELVCYNEWPTVNSLGGWYDEKRQEEQCPYEIETLSEIIKTLDGQEYGLPEPQRVIDPYFAGSTPQKTEKGMSGITVEYARYGITFTLPAREAINVQRNTIQELLKYDTQRPVSMINCPRLYIMPHCQNMIRCLERHHFEEKNEAESEKYKDFVDTLRNLLAYLGGKVVHKVPENSKKKEKIVDPWNNYKGLIRDINLG